MCSITASNMAVSWVLLVFGIIELVLKYFILGSGSMAASGSLWAGMCTSWPWGGLCAPWGPLASWGGLSTFRGPSTFRGGPSTLRGGLSTFRMGLYGISGTLKKKTIDDCYNYYTRQNLFSSSDESIRFLCLLPLLPAPLPPRPLHNLSGSLILLLGTSIKHQN